MTAPEGAMAEELFREFETRVEAVVEALERTRAERDAGRIEAARLREERDAERNHAETAIREVRGVLSSAIRILRED